MCRVACRCLTVVECAVQSVWQRAVMRWRFNETWGGFILLGVVTVMFATVLLVGSIGRSPAAKTTGVVTGLWGGHDELGTYSGLLLRLADGRVARVGQPVRRNCKVGDAIGVWDRPTLLGRQVLLREQGCRKVYRHIPSSDFNSIGKGGTASPLARIASSSVVGCGARAGSASVL